MNDEFKKLIGEVETLKDNNQSQAFKHNSKKANKQTAVPIQRERVAISESAYNIKREDFIEFRSSGVQISVLKALARGDYKPIVSIDLHNMTSEAAEHYLADTIASVQRPHLCAIKVIHGKGYHQGDRLSADLPVLKNFVYHYLKQHPRVLAFTSTPTRHGGTGALYVLIRKSPDNGLK